MRELGKATILFVVVLMVAGPVMAQTVGYWRFEGDMTDSSVNARHGTPVHMQEDGTPIAPNPYTPVYGAAAVNPVPLTGDANASSLLITAVYDDNKYMAAPGVDMTGGSITIEFWAMTTTEDENTWWVAVAQDREKVLGDQTYYPPWSIEHDPRAGRGWTFNMRSVTTGTDMLGYSVRSDVHTVANTWVHIAGVYDASLAEKQMKLYIDGVLASEIDNAVGLLGNTEDFLAGAKGYGPDAGYIAYPYSYTPEDGYIDEYRISDVALLPSQFLCGSGGGYPGDADGDGDVDDIDLGALLNGWGMANATWGDGDFDADQDVDDLDLGALLNNWGTTAPIEAVPEPAFATLLLIGLPWVVRRRVGKRRRM